MKATSPALGPRCCHWQWYHRRLAQPFEKPCWDKYLQQSSEIHFKNLVFHVTASRQEAASTGEVLALKKDKLQTYVGPKRPLAARWALFLRPGVSQHRDSEGGMTKSFWQRAAFPWPRGFAVTSRCQWCPGKAQRRSQGRGPCSGKDKTHHE